MNRESLEAMHMKYNCLDHNPGPVVPQPSHTHALWSPPQNRRLFSSFWQACKRTCLCELASSFSLSAFLLCSASAPWPAVIVIGSTGSKFDGAMFSVAASSCASAAYALWAGAVVVSGAEARARARARARAKAQAMGL